MSDKKQTTLYLSIQVMNQYAEKYGADLLAVTLNCEEESLDLDFVRSDELDTTTVQTKDNDEPNSN